jgi:hypothetical protein
MALTQDNVHTPHNFAVCPISWLHVSTSDGQLDCCTVRCQLVPTFLRNGTYTAHIQEELMCLRRLGVVLYRSVSSCRRFEGSYCTPLQGYAVHELLDPEY